MKDPNEKLLILFESMHYIIKVERFFRRDGVLCEVIPVPRHISSQCGLVLKILEIQQHRAREIMDTQNIPYTIHQERVDENN